MMSNQMARGLKFKCKVRKKTIKVLVDRCYVEFHYLKDCGNLQLIVHTILDYLVTKSTNGKVFGSTRCSEVIINFLSLTIYENFLILLLTLVEIILGLKWLKYARKITIDFNNSTLTLKLETYNIILYVVEFISDHNISLKSFSKIHQCSALCVELYFIEIMTDASSKSSQE